MIATITQGPRPHQGSSTRTTSATTSSTPDPDDSESLEPTSTCCSFPRTDGGPLHLDDILEPTAFSPTPASSSCSTHVTPSPISIFSTPQSRYTELVRHRGVQRQRGAEPAAAQPRTLQTTAAGEGSAEENSSHQPLGKQQNSIREGDARTLKGEGCCCCRAWSLVVVAAVCLIIFWG